MSDFSFIWFCCHKFVVLSFLSFFPLFDFYSFYSTCKYPTQPYLGMFTAGANFAVMVFTGRSVTKIQNIAANELHTKVWLMLYTHDEGMKPQHFVIKIHIFLFFLESKLLWFERNRDERRWMKTDTLTITSSLDHTTVLSSRPYLALLSREVLNQSGLLAPAGNPATYWRSLNLFWP